MSSAMIHEAYLAAGADIIETNTFGATSIVLAEYDIADKAREMNLAAARLAAEAANKYSDSRNGRDSSRAPSVRRRRRCPSPAA